jgi:hypothetical protein
LCADFPLRLARYAAPAFQFDEDRRPIGYDEHVGQTGFYASSPLKEPAESRARLALYTAPKHRIRKVCRQQLGEPRLRVKFLTPFLPPVLTTLNDTVCLTL